MKLEVLTPVKKLFEGEIESIHVPGEKGSFTVLHNHAPIVSTLQRGVIRIVSRGHADQNIEISGGIIEVKKNNIIVLADQE
ncbi:MAG: ATP synthase F1 subunit epsilon [Bacteroidales bacterium]|nr:ATP synthase F1 subunit epsilon [Bacteroidales bacterium]